MQVLFGPCGLSSAFGTSQNIDLIIWYSEKSETAANYKSLAVRNIATRSRRLLEFHFRMVGLVL